MILATIIKGNSSLLVSSLYSQEQVEKPNAKEITDFQETSNNQTTRGLEINFGKDDRVIEVTGTQMGQGDIATVTEQVSETSPTTGAGIKDNASQAGANISQTGSSIVNQTGEGCTNLCK